MESKRIWQRLTHYLFAEVRCPPIVTLKNISLSPPACGKRSMPQGSTCLLTCSQGYTLQGNRKAVCLGSGNWTANVLKVICAGMYVCVCRSVSFFLTKKLTMYTLGSEVWPINRVKRWGGRPEVQRSCHFAREQSDWDVDAMVLCTLSLVFLQWQSNNGIVNEISSYII